MPQLGVGAARDHPPQLGRPRIRPHAVHPVREPQPDRAAGALHRSRQRHIVDHRMPDRVRDTRPLRGLPPQQHTAPGRRRGPRPGTVDPPEGVQLPEEVDEGRHDQPLPERHRPQPCHLRHQIQPRRPGRRHQLPQTVGVVRDIRVGQQQILRRDALARQRDPVPYGPELARPPGLRLAGCGHRQRQPAARGRQLPGQRTGPVRTAVVDQEHLGPARVLLPEQRRQAVRQHRGLVPRRDHHRDRRPALRIAAVRQPYVRPPEEALPQQQPHPGQQGPGTDPLHRSHGRSLPHRIRHAPAIGRVSRKRDGTDRYARNGPGRRPSGAVRPGPGRRPAVPARYDKPDARLSKVSG